MNVLYLLPDGLKLYAPDRPVTESFAEVLRDRLSDSFVPHGLLIWGEPVQVVDLREPAATVAIVEIPAS